MKYPNSRILIFCKSPILGTVKTRMQPFLTQEASVVLHKSLVIKTIDLAVKSNLSPVQVWCAPDFSHEFFLDILEQYPVTLHKQMGNDLGQKMSYSLSSILEEAESAILIGTDCPSFVSADLEEALTAMNNNADIVISPAEDGGYTLVGMKRFTPEVFEGIDWGTETVFEKTVSNISILNRRLAILDTQWDIDRPEDLQRYKKILAEKD